MRLGCANHLLFLILLCSAACSAGPGAATPGSIPTSQNTPAATRTSASPAPTSTPTGETPLVRETPTPPSPNFTEPFDVLPPRWAFLHIDNGQALASPVARDGFLVFDLPASNEWGYALYQGRPYSDVAITAQVQYRTEGDGAAGVICRYDESRGWYELSVFQDQTYQLLFGQWLASGVARYTPLYRGQSTKIQPDSNEIGLECQGSTLTPIINGVNQHQWQEQKFALPQGEIGLAASSFADAPARIAFDSVQVTEP